MPHRTGRKQRSWKDRALSLLLAAALTAGMLPGLTLSSAAEHWADGYLDQLVEWGVMRADQTGNPDSPLTRAEFMAIVNRAYGYTKTGPIPFTDVSPDDWFYDDVSIAYTAGYTLGTSATTAHPNQPLNREQAVCILARNMMMKEGSGENLAFSDARNISSWARGLIKTAVDNYIVNGYPDGSFGPQDHVSKGQMASLIVQCVGTPLNRAGEHTLGDVFGNVTITTSGVTLRNTTVSGDLYVSAGVGLGNVKLENVNVLGRIIVSGTGESEQGDASVVMRNVTANEMLVDNMKDQLVTLRAEGLTNIGQTTVRTPAYLEDNTPDGFGLRKITNESANSRLTLAGRIKEVLNTAPGSTVHLAKGTVAKLTVDESAGAGTTVQLDRNTEVKEFNLDVGANVTGQGDVDRMNINASGVTVAPTVLPEDLYIRPGLIADVGGDPEMDSAKAEEYSTDPKILSGYPQANDVAPTSLRADFAGNKKGTVYWAVSSITDGSITAEDLISPPTYGSRAVKSGSIATPSAETAVSARITGLTVGGSYYLSAVLVDARGERSPVKVISFTTPDNTKPAFAQGYPYMSLVTDSLAQATVMATKSCKLYYAVLPQGAQAPTVNDLKSAAVTGNLGYGVMDVVKNTEHTFTISRQLEELKNYVAYFWLTDADGANSSSIVSLRFTTLDKTPPEFVTPPHTVGTPSATNVPMAATLNEDGTIYWAVVPAGTDYPLKQPGVDGDPDYPKRAPLDSDYARLQIANQMNAFKTGALTVKANTEAKFSVSGLEAGKAYDFYYLAMDKAGNYSMPVVRLEGGIHTKDEVKPYVVQYFDSFAGDDRTQNPRVNTTIFLEFSENVRCSAAGANDTDFLTLYQKAKKNEDGITMDIFAETLEQSIVLYETASAPPQPVEVRDKDNETPNSSVWIDYRKATVTSGDNGAVVVNFPYSADDDKTSHRLDSAATYYFELSNIVDTTTIGQPNPLERTPTRYNNHGPKDVIPTFTTVFAEVTLSPPTNLGDNTPYKWLRTASTPTWSTTDRAALDFTFQMTPTSTERVDSSNKFDIMLYANTMMAYDVYCRIVKPDKTYATAAEAPELGINPKDTKENWFYLGNSGDVTPINNQLAGTSLNGGEKLGNLSGSATPFPEVQKLKEKYQYQFVVSMTRLGSVDESDRESWNNDSLKLRVYVIAGPGDKLKTFSRNRAEDRLLAMDKEPLNSSNGGLKIISSTNTTDRFLDISQTIEDTRVPFFYDKYPTIDAGDTFATIDVALNQKNSYLYYKVAPVGDIGTTITGQASLSDEKTWEALPKSGAPYDDTGSTTYPLTFENPSRYDISDLVANTDMTKVPANGQPMLFASQNSRQQIKLSGLEPRTKYIAYFVLKGKSSDMSPVYAFQFETTDVSRPKLTPAPNQDVTVPISTQVAADVYYRAFTTGDAKQIPILKKPFAPTSKIPAPYNKAGMTVLEALITVYDDSSVTAAADKKGTQYTGSSIFDLFASDNDKNEVYRLITGDPTVDMGSAAVTEVNYGGPKTTTGSGTNYVTELTQADLSNINDETKNTGYKNTYVLLVAGCNVNSDKTREPCDIYGFRAAENIRKVSTVAPVLTSFDVHQFEPSSSGKFYGSCTLTFDKDLYWVPAGITNENKIPVDASDDAYTPGTGTPPTGASTSVGISSGVTEFTASGGKGPRNQFKLNFNGITVGQSGSISFQLLSGGQFASENSQSTSARLTITVIDTRNQANAGVKFENIQSGLPVQYVMVAYWDGKMVSDNYRRVG